MRLPLLDPISRRRFFRLAGAGAALAGLDACSRGPPEDVVPYVRRPPEVVPGVPSFYATSVTRGPYGIGVLAESHAGRPTKLEGHPKHPASQGALGAIEQASILSLYDPDRLRGISHAGVPRSWNQLAAAFGPSSQRPFAQRQGQGLHLVLPATTSALTAALIGRLVELYPRATITFHSPRAPLESWQGARHVFGRVVETVPAPAAAEVLLALDSNFLDGEPLSLGHARAFARRRRPSRPDDPMSRLWAVECALSVTGACADHRLAVAPSAVSRTAAALLAALGRQLPDGDARTVARKADDLLKASPHREWIERLAHDLAAAGPQALVSVGERQPHAVHVLGHALTALLGSVGTTLEYRASPVLDAGEAAFDTRSLLQDLEAGAVTTLIVVGENVAYSWASGAQLARLVERVAERVHLTAYANETSALATWLVPQAHLLESWGDVTSQDGTPSFVQPLIRPLFAGKTGDELLSLLLGQPERSGRELWREHWVRALGAQAASTALREGLLEERRTSVESVTLDWDAVASAVDSVAREPPAGLELSFGLDVRVEDGRGANNAWLQELPDPITKLVWGNAALIGERTAAEHGVQTGDEIEISAGGRALRIPALVQRLHAEGALSLWLGFGRRGAEQTARDVGVDVSPLRAGPGWSAIGAAFAKTGERRELVTTQPHDSMEDRPIALARTRREWQREPSFAEHHDAPPRSILPDRLHGGPQWGMSIDLSACTGCSACVVACQVENNVPAVGRAQVALGREMHWLRIDRYYVGEGVRLQPMVCQHCEKAPCEYVCPVAATSHSPDGLNEMVYNRCVGTRYCSNNCPYKVRRFNFLSYTGPRPELFSMAANPDVTVRARGVMEKCTYCVQRIRRAQIDAKLEQRPLRDGDVITACQATCPTEAIRFGDLSDPSSRVSQAQRELRAYAVLGELGTFPRTRYLARISNRLPRADG